MWGRGKRAVGVPEDQPVEVLGDDGRIGPESLEFDERISDFPLGKDEVGYEKFFPGEAREKVLAAVGPPVEEGVTT